jgi:DNA mismatch endonuclease (patch repair protein)
VLQHHPNRSLTHLGCVPRQLVHAPILSRFGASEKAGAVHTGIEVTVRKGLHRLGFRYRLGGEGLPGRPDIVLPKYRAVVFVHGCFWHGHACPLFRLPKTRTAFWQSKIEANRKRDSRIADELRRSDWNVHMIWECQIRNLKTLEVARVIQSLAVSIKRQKHSME